jgi:6-phosphogluconolactonase (cycloisomerase 2 family)
MKRGTGHRQAAADDMAELGLLRKILLGITAACCLLPSANSQDRVFVVVAPFGSAGPSALVAFDVDAQGLLTQRESYSTGGDGYGGDSDQELALDSSGRFLFAPNNGSSSVSVFNISPDGVLSSVPGSPFGTGAGPMAVALNPNGSQAFVTQWRDATIGVFSVDSLGRMNPTQVLASPYPRELCVDSLGRCLYLADMDLGLRAYDLHSPDGQLHEISGSPFSGYAVSRPFYARISPNGSRALLLDLDLGFAAYNLAANGTPSFVDLLTLTSPGPIQLMPASNLAYVAFSAETRIRGYNVEGNGTPTELPGSPFPAELHTEAMACSPNGTRLYAVTRENARLQIFAVATNGSLTTLGSTLQVNDPANRLPTGIVYWPSTRPRLAIIPDGSGGYFIRFNGIPGNAYRLQRAPTVTGPWASSSPQTAPTSGVVEFHDLFTLPEQAFYRTIQP